MGKRINQEKVSKLPSHIMPLVSDLEFHASRLDASFRDALLDRLEHGDKDYVALSYSQKSILLDAMNEVWHD